MTTGICVQKRLFCKCETQTREPGVSILTQSCKPVPKTLVLQARNTEERALNFQPESLNSQGAEEKDSGWNLKPIFHFTDSEFQTASKNVCLASAKHRQKSVASSRILKWQRGSIKRFWLKPICHYPGSKLQTVSKNVCFASAKLWRESPVSAAARIFKASSKDESFYPSCCPRNSIMI